MMQGHKLSSPGARSVLNNIAHEAVDRHGYGKLTTLDEMVRYLIAKAGKI